MNPLHYPVHHPGTRKTDSRYTVGKEYTGHERPQFVARFCGTWIGQSRFYLDAVLMAVSESARRRGCPTITAVEAVNGQTA
jgi:hypothetical protein